MTCVRISQGARIRGLWTDQVDWHALGSLHVRRASFVEFDERRQAWTVRKAIPRGWLRRCFEHLTGRPMGRVLFQAPTRVAALFWESLRFGPGGRGWPDD